jgi:prepilin peptidase CpaA
MGIMNASSAVLWIIAFAALFTALYHDLRDRLIPNRLVLVVLCAAIGLRLVNNISTLGWSFLGVIIVAGLFYAIATRGWIGWGDAKMMAAATLLVPPQFVIPLVFEIAIAGGLLSCFYLIARATTKNSELAYETATGSRPSLLGSLMRSEVARINAGEPMPYAFAIAGGVAFQFVTQVMQCSFATSCLF